MDEANLRELRRASLFGLKRSGTSEAIPRLRCSLCESPVHISMRHTEFGNRWFAHHGEKTDCPYRTFRRMSANELFAWQYQGQQEGHEHKRLKHFIADWLEKESECKNIWRDKIRHSDLKTGEWKRPDVRCIFKEYELVFEIQLSYTFLSEVIRRDTFYKSEKVHIIWIFRGFELHREVVRDELFYNRRNIFVLDEESEKESIKRNRLILKCHYQTPFLNNETISEKWSYRYVSIDNLIYAESDYRPYYRDFDEAMIRLLRLRLVRNIMRWCRAKKAKDNIKLKAIYPDVKFAWQDLYNAAIGNSLEYIDESLLLEELVPRLLSIKYGKPIGYRVSTVWQVLDSILQMSSDTKRPFNILYLIAVTQYNPFFSEEHSQRIKSFRQDIIKSIKNGEDRFIRDLRYDEAIGVIFPELKNSLDNKFGANIKTEN
jgi:hypothetical protein